MPLARGIKVIVIFNGVDISEDIAHSISSLNYTDNSKNAIDDLEFGTREHGLSLVKRMVS